MNCGSTVRPNSNARSKRRSSLPATLNGAVRIGIHRRLRLHRQQSGNNSRRPCVFVASIFPVVSGTKPVRYSRIRTGRCLVDYPARPSVSRIVRLETTNFLVGLIPSQELEDRRATVSESKAWDCQINSRNGRCSSLIRDNTPQPRNNLAVPWLYRFNAREFLHGASPAFPTCLGSLENFIGEAPKNT